MSHFTKIVASCAVALGTVALVGCDETVKKDETVRTNSDGSQTKKMEETVKESDGTMKTESSTVKIPASQAMK